MKVLDLGSLNIDHVYSVEHFVRPGETLAATKVENFCGGKGLNQAIALARAGAEVYMAGKIGPDGEMLRARLDESGVDTGFVATDAQAQTGNAIIQVDKNGQNCIILFGGANKQIGPQDIDELLKNFDSGDILLLQNEISNLKYILRAAGEKGMRVALNPSPIDSELVAAKELEYVEWFILNEIEGNELTGESEPQRICAKMQEKWPGCRVVLTLGKDGVVYSGGGETASHGIYDVKVVDTTAAGDTFCGFFLARTGAGDSVAETLRMASVASSLCVGKAGASDSIPTLAEVTASRLTPKK